MRFDTKYQIGQTVYFFPSGKMQIYKGEVAFIQISANERSVSVSYGISYLPDDRKLFHQIEVVEENRVFETKSDVAEYALQLTAGL